VNYKGFPKLVSLWKGIVRVDCSLVDKTFHSLDYGDYRIVTIKDSKYRNADNAQLDNIDGQIYFPNEVVLFIIGNEILERMWCTAVKGYNEKSYPRKIAPKIYNGLSCKGFILEPIAAYDTIDVGASLGLFQFSNEYDQEICFDRLGMYVFTSGSRTSNMTFMRDPRKSVTAAFLASRDKPIVAYIYSRDKTLRFFGDDRGIRISQIRDNKQDAQRSHTTKKSALEILKTRLAMGEISIEEYEKLRRIILEDESYTSNWI
jgi:hypothetical protein